MNKESAVATKLDSVGGELQTMDSERAVAAQADVQTLGGGILNVIARAAADPNTDVEKLERLLAMQERVLDREAEQAWIVAMKAAQEECRPIKRNKKNATTNSTYADLEKLAKEADPIIHRHGFTLTFGSGESNLEGHYRVTCDVAHIGGHTRQRFLDVPSDMTGIKGNQNKTATHGMGSAISYGRRYLKFLIFDIATTDDDDGNLAGNSGPISKEQLETLNGLADAVGSDKQKLCQYLKVDSLRDLPAFSYDAAVAVITQKNPQAAHEYLTGGK